MVGSAVCRRLSKMPCEVLTADRKELDLRNPVATQTFFQANRPTIVIFAAAKVGGIVANDSYPVEFLSDNVLMSVNAINAAFQAKVKRFLFLGSTCIYPRHADQPIQEDSLLTGPLESTNEAYALAKIAGLKLCQYYRSQHGAMFHSAMPTNLYGPGDNYHPDHSHVLPALIHRFHEAKVARKTDVQIWGSGFPRREFLHVDDLAGAITFLLGVDDPPDWVNVGTGIDQTILELADMVASCVGYRGKISTDPSRPDGTPVKCTDVRLIHSLGWHHEIDLEQGIERTYQSFLSEQQVGQLRAV